MKTVARGEAGRKQTRSRPLTGFFETNTNVAQLLIAPCPSRHSRNAVSIANGMIARYSPHLSGATDLEELICFRYCHEAAECRPSPQSNGRRFTPH
jgi:hypothetical protein